jgi:hypothetical protein
MDRAAACRRGGIHGLDPRRPGPPSELQGVAGGQAGEGRQARDAEGIGRRYRVRTESRHLHPGSAAPASRGVPAKIEALQSGSADDGTEEPTAPWPTDLSP